MLAPILITRGSCLGKEVAAIAKQKETKAL